MKMQDPICIIINIIPIIPCTKMHPLDLELAEGENQGGTSVI